MSLTTQMISMTGTIIDTDIISDSVTPRGMSVWDRETEIGYSAILDDSGVYYISKYTKATGTNTTIEIDYLINDTNSQNEEPTICLNYSGSKLVLFARNRVCTYNTIDMSINILNFNLGASGHKIIALTDDCFYFLLQDRIQKYKIINQSINALYYYYTYPFNTDMAIAKNGYLYIFRESNGEDGHYDLYKLVDYGNYFTKITFKYISFFDASISVSSDNTFLIISANNVSYYSLYLYETSSFSIVKVQKAMDSIAQPHIMAIIDYDIYMSELRVNPLSSSPINTWHIIKYTVASSFDSISDGVIISTSGGSVYDWGDPYGETRARFTLKI